MSMKSRSELRRKKIETYRARGFADAERWDLEFWQKQSPETRLSALVAIRNDIKKIKNGKRHSAHLKL